MTTCTLQVNERGSWRNVISAFDYSVAEEVKAVVSMLAAAVREALERAANACMDERVDADATESDEDEAYNLACTHCFGAINAMLEEYK